MSKSISACIAFSLLILGLVGETTPGAMGFPEMLQFSFIIGSFFLVRYLTKNEMISISIFYVLLVQGLFVSLLSQFQVNNIMRDVIPFSFILMYFPLSRISTSDRDKIYYALMFCGIFFVLRYFNKADGNVISLVGGTLSDKQYLIQDPAVLFASLFSAKKMIENLEDLRLKEALFFLVVYLLCLIGFIIMGVRAGTGLSIIYLALLIMRMNSHTVYRIFGALLVGATLFFMSDIFVALVYKFQTFGLNNKDVEFEAVFNFIGNSAFTSFLGVGFGGTFVNPVYGFEVRYTHSILSYFYLKLGVVGLLFVVTFLFFVFQQFLELAQKYFFVKFGASERIRSVLFCSLVPSVFLQPTYKSYTFALLVSLFLLEACDARSRHINKK